MHKCIRTATVWTEPTLKTTISHHLYQYATNYSNHFVSDISNTASRMLPTMMLIGIPFMAFGIAKGYDIFTTLKLTSAEDTISLECHHDFNARSRLELSIICSNEALCRAISNEGWGNFSMWCACPAHTTEPKTSNVVLSTLRIRQSMEILPGIDIVP